MKKFIITCFYFTLTLAIAAAGYLLPAASFSFQDQQMSADVEYSKIEPIAFTYSSSLLDTIRLMSSSYYTVEYPLTGSSRTAKEISQITLDAIEQLADHGLTILGSKEDVLGYNATLLLAISDYSDTDIDQVPTDAGNADVYDQSADTIDDTGQPRDAEDTAPDSRDITSAIIWQCYLYTADGIEANFKIDDKSGKVAGFCIWSYPNSLISNGDTFYEIRNKLCSFARDYYGLPAKTLTQKIKSVTDPLTNEAEYTTSLLRYFVVLSEESGDKIKMPLQIYPDNWMLN